MGGRGVWRLPFLSKDGCPIVVAVSAAGREVAWCDVAPGYDVEATRAGLQALLDEHDPVRAFTVLRGGLAGATARGTRPRAARPRQTHSLSLVAGGL